jgi:hypothetical protein
MAAEAIELVALGGHADSGYMTAATLDKAALRLDFTVSEALPNSLLCVGLDTGPDGENWREIGSFEATGVGTQRMTFGALDARVRVRWIARNKFRGFDHGFVWSLTGESV